MTKKDKRSGSGDKVTRARGRRAVLDLLKQDGAQDAQSLGTQLGVSAMAVRQQLYDMQEQGLVTYEEEARPMGRPAKLWRLTPAADSFFPDGHAELTVSLLQAMRQAYGDEGVERLLQIRSAEQTKAYGARLGADGALNERLARLAEIRSQEGYMAAVLPQDDGSYLLIENHCPICAAARACSGLCAAELAVFRSVLGDDVDIERVDHILAGARRCAYRVRPRLPAADAA